ncbi:hypothetical protein JOQ06_011141 [Pogonophryne albipinna]|uniref:Transposase n=1 Tax=Pogonophryne albipinna TaxID=1090488 RepID=A0AAD6FF23_9TELE|nr:hypothetical protein JOQ06_011141 [Pogonophryne albipinna]
MVFTDFTVKEAFLALIPLKERTRGEDVYKAFKDYVREYKIPIHKIVSFTTDGAPAMLSVRSGFVALCRKDPDFPPFVNYHCVIHQQALAAKAIDMSHVMNDVVKILNSIRAKALQHRLFKSLLDELDSVYGDLILHADVRWLSRGKVLQRFLDLLPEIISFLKSRNEEYEQLSDDTWLLDLGFLTDLTAKFNDLNRELQGKDRELGHMISAVEAFKVKLSLWTTQLRHARLTHFPNLEKVSQNLTDKTAFHPEQFCAHLNKLTSEFGARFVELQDMGQVVGFVSNPFLSVDIEQLSAKMQVFTLPMGVDMEISEMQSDIELKARARDQDFWSLQMELIMETYEKSVAEPEDTMTDQEVQVIPVQESCALPAACAKTDCVHPVHHTSVETQTDSALQTSPDMQDDDEDEDEDEPTPSSDEEYKLPSGSEAEDSDSGSGMEDSCDGPVTLDKEVKFIVFRSSLQQLLRWCHCPSCGSVDFTHTSKNIGTLLLVTVCCGSCYKKSTWQSQPYIGPYPAGNILLSASLLFAGATATKCLRVLTHMNIASISGRTFFRHQSSILQPAVQRVWKKEQMELFAVLMTEDRKLVLGGDGRADSPGHSAKYGTYTALEVPSNVIIDIQQVQVCVITLGLNPLAHLNSHFRIDQVMVQLGREFILYQASSSVVIMT